jgi:hypothetical protein
MLWYADWGGRSICSSASSTVGRHDFNGDPQVIEAASMAHVRRMRVERSLERSTGMASACGGGPSRVGIRRLVVYVAS